FDTANSISPELLARFGFSEAAQEADIISDLRSWIGLTSKSGDRKAALEMASQALKSHWKFASRADLAELQFTAASLAWPQSKSTGLGLLFRAVAGKPG